MKTRLLILAAGCFVLASSCRKHECECETSIYDNEGYYVSSSTEVKEVKAMSTLKALEKCDDLETTPDTYCYLY